MNKREFWNGLKVAFLIIGTTIGAGFASGREIWEFFASYGPGSSVYVLLSMVLFAVSCHVIMSISHHLNAPNYTHVLEELIGKPLAKVYDLFILVYLLSTSVIMFAGSGATLQYWSVSYWVGIALIGLLVLLVFVRGIEGMMSLNSILIPVLIMTLIMACVLFLWGGYGEKEDVATNEHIFSSAIAFTALNILPMIAILSAIGAKIKQSEMRTASVCSALGLGLVGLVYNETLLQVANEVMLYEVPLYAILRFFSAEFTIVVSFVLWFAIYTTAISGVFGLVSRFNRVAMPQWALAGICILVILPLTRFGFTNLIKFLYPLYGVLNLFILAMILLYPLAKMKKIK